MFRSIDISREILCDEAIKIKLYDFCDASENAYGACLYIHNTSSNLKYTIRLLCAKSRVAPMEKISLLKLELCSAALLANLSEKAIQTLDINFKEIHYWSNSTIVLSWISHESSRRNTFVANRVTEIHRIAGQVQWHHIRSQENPTDPLSRRINPDKLKATRIWWEGPAFLTQ